MKQYINIRDCKDGDIVAEDIYFDIYNIPIIMKNSVINEYVKEKIMNYNIEFIHIIRNTSEAKKENILNKSSFKKEYEKNISKIKSFFANIAKGRKVDSNDIINISNSLMNSSGDICKVLETMHSFKNVDDYTFNHSINVALYSMLMGKWLELEEYEIRDIIKAGILHDIGKAKIPIDILNKKGSLTEEEFNKIKEHTTIGYNLCKEFNWLDEDIKKVVLFHHEREDGSGYPLGLKGDKISLYTKIVAIADIYDALTSERVYKAKQTPFDTFKHIIDLGYGKIDVLILRKFLSNIASFYTGEKVRMSNGEIGEIVFVPPHNIIYPIVKVDEMYHDLSKKPDYKIIEII